MAKSSSAPPKITVKSLSFFLTSFQKLLTLISEILSKFSFDWYTTCYGFFQRNVSKNLLEGAKKGGFRAIFSGDNSNTSKAKVYFWHLPIPGGQKTSLGFLTLSKWSNKSRSPAEIGQKYITGDRYVTNKCSWHFDEIFPLISSFEWKRLENISDSKEKCLKCRVTVLDQDSMS